MPSIAAYGDATPDPATQEAAYRQTGMRSTPMTRRVIAGRALIQDLFFVEAARTACHERQSAIY